MKTNKQLWKETRRRQAKDLNTYRTAPANLEIHFVSHGQIYLKTQKTYEEFLTFLERLNNDYELYTSYLVDEKEIQLTFKQIRNPNIQIVYRNEDAIKITKEYLNLECKITKTITNNSHTSYSLECAN